MPLANSVDFKNESASKTEFITYSQLTPSNDQLDSTIQFLSTYYLDSNSSTTENYTNTEDSNSELFYPVHDQELITLNLNNETIIHPFCSYCKQKGCDCSNRNGSTQHLNQFRSICVSDGKQTENNHQNNSQTTTKDPAFAPITLADYLEQLNGHDHKGAPDCTAGKPVLRKLSRIPMSLSNGFIPQMPNSQIPSQFISSAKKSDGSSNVTHSTINYLLKKRVFIIDKLVDCYTELFKLLHEELAITGHAPKNYLESIHAYYELLDIAKQQTDLKSYDGKRNYTTECRQSSNSQIIQRPELPVPPFFNGLRGNRLQETGFLLSPRVIRNSAIKISPSANLLLNSSRLSLCGDTQTKTYNNDPPRLKNSLTVSMSTEQLSSSGKLQKDHGNGNLGSDQYATQKRSGKLNRLGRPSIFARRKSNHYQSNNICSTGCTNSVNFNSSPSLTETNMKEETEHLNKLTKTDLKVTTKSENSSTDQDARLPLLNDLQLKDIEQAIAWIQVEINAVQNILSANVRCANESKRSWDSRKAYRHAAKQNKQTITILQHQLRTLERKLNETIEGSDLITQSSLSSDKLTTDKSAESEKNLFQEALWKPKSTSRKLSNGNLGGSLLLRTRNCFTPSSDTYRSTQDKLHDSYYRSEVCGQYNSSPEAISISAASGDDLSLASAENWTKGPCQSYHSNIFGSGCDSNSCISSISKNSGYDENNLHLMGEASAKDKCNQQAKEVRTQIYPSPQSDYIASQLNPISRLVVPSVDTNISPFLVNQKTDNCIHDETIENTSDDVPVSQPVSCRRTSIPGHVISINSPPGTTNKSLNSSLRRSGTNENGTEEVMRNPVNSSIISKPLTQNIVSTVLDSKRLDDYITTVEFERCLQSCDTSTKNALTKTCEEEKPVSVIYLTPHCSNKYSCPQSFKSSSFAVQERPCLSSITFDKVKLPKHVINIADSEIINQHSTILYPGLSRSPSLLDIQCASQLLTTSSLIPVYSATTERSVILDGNKSSNSNHHPTSLTNFKSNSSDFHSNSSSGRVIYPSVKLQSTHWYVAPGELQSSDLVHNSTTFKYI